LTVALNRFDDRCRTMPDSVPKPVAESLPADWGRSTYDSEAFGEEQCRFAHVWTFLGLTSDVERENDWLRASIGLRSVFVQRIRGELRGFENRCAHRFFLLRVADKGNGPIVCGFHHWRYDEHGRAFGVPVSEEVFGAGSRQLNVGLTRIDIAVCGSLIFGRFPAPGATETLEEFLGPCFPVLAALSRMTLPPYYFSRPVEAHWKLCMHVAVDDYHLAAIHPTTFGKGNLYLKRENLTYTQAGAHSVYQTEAGSNAFADLIATLGNGMASNDRYIVVHLMPGLVLSYAHVWDGYFACALTHYAPVSHHRSVQRMWVYPSPLRQNAGRMPSLLRPFRDAVLRRVSFHYGCHILDEDAQAAERLQTNAPTFSGSPLIGRLEERVLWYETAYRKIMARDVARPRT
jgi:phenylpropionate dioxygenase-like ring-hydroxylating dioxygenase large terminal subunit